MTRVLALLVCVCVCVLAHLLACLLTFSLLLCCPEDPLGDPEANIKSDFFFCTNLGT